jgi:hypothetical protein
VTNWTSSWIELLKGSLSVEPPLLMTSCAPSCLAGKKVRLGRVWSHMLRHSSGYYPVEKGTDLHDAGLLWTSGSTPTAHYAPLRGAVEVALGGAGLPSGEQYASVNSGDTPTFTVPEPRRPTQLPVEHP